MAKPLQETGGEGAAPQAPCTFMLAAPQRPVTANGWRRPLPPGPAQTLAARTRAFFADHPDAPMLVGAIPFDRTADDALFEPCSVTDLPLAPPLTGPRPDRQWRVVPQPSREEYMRAVAHALELIARDRGKADALDKIVLSRSVLLEARPPIDLLALSSRLLGDPAAVRFLTPLGPGANGVQRHLVGATPELLIARTGDAVVSHPLAGSARRSADTQADRAAADWLLGSEKDRREHRWVVEAILDGLAPYCRELAAPEAPSLVATQTMWHLGTRIEGRLRTPEAVSAAELAAVLHPTPAVGGTPRGRALELIPQLEGYGRSFYAGAVGWTDRAGDGEWYVSLRCAEVSGSQIRIYAGAGIVEGSTPEEEAQETSAKLLAMLRALGVDEQGNSPGAGACAAPDSGTVPGQRALAGR